MRLDLKQPEDIQYHSDESSWMDSIQSRLPDPSLGLSDPTAGSNVLEVIDRFLDNTYLPLCGARIHVTLKRYPNETDIEKLVSKIRQHQAVVSVVIQTDSTGGFHPETMYNLATRTNGLGFFDAAYWSPSIEEDMSVFYDSPSLVYSVNANVSQVGSMTLPSYYSSNNTYHLIMLTVQDSEVRSSFQSFSLNFTSPTDTQILNLTNCESNRASNFIECYFHFEAGNYTVTLNYAYNDTQQQSLQLRMNTYEHIDYWIPYAD